MIAQGGFMPGYKKEISPFKRAMERFLSKHPERRIQKSPPPPVKAPPIQDQPLPPMTNTPVSVGAAVNRLSSLMTGGRVVTGTAGLRVGIKPYGAFAARVRKRGKT